VGLGISFSRVLDSGDEEAAWLNH